MSSWEDDKRITDPYLPMVKAICGVFIIREAPIEEDREHNTDLIVLTVGSERISVRLRAPYYFKHPLFQHEFTMRDSRPSGVQTEFAKVLQGWGNYLFYGFRTEQPPRLWGFGLLDLGIFRIWALEYAEKWGRYPGRIYPNADKSSSLRAIRWDAVPPKAILTMYPKKIAIGNTLMPKTTQEAIQLALGLSLDANE